DLTASVSYSNDSDVSQTRTRRGVETFGIPSATRTLEMPSNFKTWELRFSPEPKRDSNGKIIRIPSAEPRIQKREITNEEFASRMALAEKSGPVGDKIKGFFKEDVKNFFQEVGEDIKEGWSLAVNWLEDGLNFVITIAGKAVTWIVEKVEQVVAF